MARPSVAESAYLRELGERLNPGIDVFWTGPEIVSREIPVASLLELAAILKRKPLIWDNLHANDYDLRRIYFGPYGGRTGGVRDAVRGVLSNPNNEFEANFVPLRTLAMYAQTTLTSRVKPTSAPSRSGFPGSGGTARRPSPWMSSSCSATISTCHSSMARGPARC